MVNRTAVLCPLSWKQPDDIPHNRRNSCIFHAHFYRTRGCDASTDSTNGRDFSWRVVSAGDGWEQFLVASAV
eukprot:gene689-3989_t